MRVIRHYADVPEAWAIRRPEMELDLGPEKSPEEKKAELKSIADKFTAVNEEQPRRRVRAI